MVPIMDKPAFEAIEDGHSTPEFDAKTLNVDEKRLIRKCDIRILPWLSVSAMTYCLIRFVFLQYWRREGP